MLSRFHFKKRSSTKAVAVRDVEPDATPRVPVRTIKTRLSPRVEPPAKGRRPSDTSTIDMPLSESIVPVLYITEQSPRTQEEVEREPQPDPTPAPVPPPPTLGRLGDFRSSLIMADLSKRFSVLRSDGDSQAAHTYSLGGIFEDYGSGSPPSTRRPSAPFSPLRTHSAIRAERLTRALPLTPSYLGITPSSPSPSHISDVTITPAAFPTRRSDKRTALAPALQPSPRGDPSATPRPRPRSTYASHRLSYGTPRNITNFRRGGNAIGTLFASSRVESVELPPKGSSSRGSRASSRASKRVSDLSVISQRGVRSSSPAPPLKTVGLGFRGEESDDEDSCDTARAIPPRRPRPKRMRVSFTAAVKDTKRDSVHSIGKRRRASSGGSSLARADSSRSRTSAKHLSDLAGSRIGVAVDFGCDQRQFDEDPFAFLSLLLPPLQTSAPTSLPLEDYPTSISSPTPSSPFATTNENCKSSRRRTGSSGFDFGLLELYTDSRSSLSSSASSMAEQSTAPTSPDQDQDQDQDDQPESSSEVETEASVDVVWQTLRNNSKNRASTKTAVSWGSSEAELPPLPQKPTERFSFFRRKSPVVAEVGPWGGALAAVAPRRVRVPAYI